MKQMNQRQPLQSLDEANDSHEQHANNTKTNGHLHRNLSPTGHTPEGETRHTRRSFSKIHRKFSDQELSRSTAHKFLLDEIDRLERDNEHLKNYRERYYDAAKRCAILEEHQSRSAPHEVLFGLCLTMGAAALGFAPSVWEQQPGGWILIAFGAILVIGGVLARMLARHR